MTISTQSSKAIGRGNGATTSFAYSFLIPTAADVLVTYVDADGVETALSTSQYSISGIGDPAGGTVTYPLAGSPIATGTSITIARELSLTQPVDLENQGGYYPSVVEGGLDRIVMLLQQIANGARDYPLAMTFPAVDVDPETELPPAAARANRYLAFDASGNPLMMAGTSSSPDISSNTILATGGTTTRTAAQWMTDVINVKAWGALGNGVADDTAEILDALDQLQPTVGGVLFFPAGTYITSAAIALPAAATGYVIKGSGKHNTVIRTTSTTADMLTAPSTAQLIVVEDLQFESLVSRSAGSAIAFTGTQQFELRRLRLIDTFNLITLNGCGIGIIDDIQVAHGAGAINRGLWMQSCIDVRVMRVVASGGNLNLNSANAWFMIDSGCDTIQMFQCISICTTGTGKGLIVSHSLSPSSFAPRWIRVTDCNFEGSSGAAGNVNAQNGITISDGANVYFSGCYVATSLNGIVITGGEDIRFDRQIVVNCDRHGISLATCDIVGIYNSTISDCSAAANNTYDGINIASTATNVALGGGLYIGDAILTNANKMRYGINNASASCVLETANFGNFGTAVANGIVGPTSGTYTPSWTGSTTNGVIGNGSISGEWFRSDKSITVVISLNIGSTTTLATGVWSFSLPFATVSVINTTGTALGICAGAIIAGGARLAGAASTVQVGVQGQANYVTEAIPGAWTTGDSLNITITYQQRP